MKYFSIVFIIGLFLYGCTSSKARQEKQDKWKSRAIEYFNSDTALTRQIAAKIKVQEGDTICDIGAGGGMGSALLAKYLPDIIYFEEDINKRECNKKNFNYVFNLLSVDAKIDNYRFFIGTDKKLPFADNSFSTVLLFKTIHEFTYKEIMMQEIKRILRNDGRLYIRESVYFKTPITDSTCHHPYLSEKDLYQLVKEAGLGIVPDNDFNKYDSAANGGTSFLECYKLP